MVKRDANSFFYKNSSTNILLFNSLVPQQSLVVLWFFSPLLLSFFSPVLLSARKESLVLLSAKNRFFSLATQIGSSLRKESFLLSVATGWFFSPQQLVLLSATIFGYSLRMTISRKKHPEKESYRRKCVPYYDELCVLFGDDQATGGNAITGNEANIELPSLEEMCNAEKSLPTKEEKDEVNQSSSSVTPTGSNGQRTKRKKCSNIDATEQGLTAVANRLADAFAHTDMHALKELHNIPELSREDVMRAMLLLGGEVKDANIFFHLNEDLKKDWVLLYLQRKF
ncbi:hypothetical protein Syun_000862 [Stephania yunnanensis]|uniref:Uncharacterized protein n=1 Tax=Stephania yunnanensis TaxID=152371 RepID=A0AAP0LEG4_9MAGN